MSNAPTSDQDAFAARLVDYAEEAGRRLLERVVWIQTFQAIYADPIVTEDAAAKRADGTLELYRKRFGGSE